MSEMGNAGKADPRTYLEPYDVCALHASLSLVPRTVGKKPSHLFQHYNYLSIVADSLHFAEQVTASTPT